MNQFKKREILQLVNVDLLGEGVDVPAIEVVSMVRPTHSYIVYAQQFGRALRPMPGKTHAIIIDHVGNINRHKLPDANKIWSLERRERRFRSAATDIIDTRTCLNANCLSVYLRIYKKCPFCDTPSPAPAARSSPEFVDGDLFELDEETLCKLRGEINRIDGTAHPPSHLDAVAQRAVVNRHNARQLSQQFLREQIALWAGQYKAKNYDDSMIYRQFYLTFGIDVMTAQTLGVKEAEKLQERIAHDLVIIA